MDTAPKQVLQTVAGGKEKYTNRQAEQKVCRLQMTTWTGYWIELLLEFMPEHHYGTQTDGVGSRRVK